MTHGTIHIPQDLDDKEAVMSVLGQLNLLKTGAKTFSSKEIGAALHWARVPADQHSRLKAAMKRHGLFWRSRPQRGMQSRHPIQPA